MGGLVLRRLAALPPTLAAILCLSFLVVRLAPGSPFAAERATEPAVRARLEARYGLDQPLWRQLGRYVIGIACRGDFGPSLKYPGRQVGEILSAALPVTLTLGATALALAVTLGTGAGVACALARGRASDRLGQAAALAATCCPAFVLGPLLVAGVGATGWWLPPAGWGAPRHLALPAATLAAGYAGAIARLTRAGVLEVLGQDHVRAARARGLAPARVLWAYVLPGGLMPLLGYLGPAATHLLVGSVVVEKLFAIPGLGRQVVDAAFNRDYFLIMGVVIVEATVLLSVNAAAELGQAALDPRARGLAP